MFVQKHLREKESEEKKQAIAKPFALQANPNLDVAKNA